MEISADGYVTKTVDIIPEVGKSLLEVDVDLLKQ